jgi:hypothetical protein
MEQAKKKQPINHKPLGKMAQLNKAGLNEELSDLEAQIEKLKAVKFKQEQEAAQKEAERKAAEKKERLAEKLFSAFAEMGMQVPDFPPVGVHREIPEVQTSTEQAAPVVEAPAAKPIREIGKGISTQKGLYLMIGIFAVFFLWFIGYGVFGSMNDSEVRITNAAYLHFISHIWLSISVVLAGFGIQFLLFNQQCRYLWTNVQTEHSFQTDFWSPSYEGLIRLITCLFTWAFPTFIIAWVFQLILG